MLKRTPYSLEQQKFSNAGHLNAQRTIYPELFHVQRDQLEFVVLDEEEAKEQDCEHAIDRLVRVSVTGLKGKIVFTVQERFRNTKYAPYQDITITEWNHRSNLPSELYKIRADLFLYGYYNFPSDSMLQVIAFHVSPFKARIAQKTMAFDTGKNEKDQTFITVKFTDLIRSGVVEFHKLWRSV